ncbi:hypothetical protein T01_10209 [Trichinella spiralis]|uniref:Uncharacterized protein n=1 Tax=Trichinella spiralis TaxID=6334 RepID=A0A0V1ATC7_TRISP|nr:hypothetical protein T01_10209 [Trichinella spiralis]
MCGYLIVLSLSNNDAIAICIISITCIRPGGIHQLSAEELIPCLSKTAAYRSSFVPIKGEKIDSPVGKTNESIPYSFDPNYPNDKNSVLEKFSYNCEKGLKIL